MTRQLDLGRRAATRDQLLEELIVSLTSGVSASLPLRDRALDEPTVALLDAWATVGDVIGFYGDRIAEEGYLSSAREAGSILALASLVGKRPQLGIAARVYLAYALNADPDDKALVLAPGLLSQSVPGAGEQPQTFETMASLVARPSWNVLQPKLTKPLTVESRAAAAALDSIVVDGTNAALSANDIILLTLAGDPVPVTLRVAGSTPDPVRHLTTVALQHPRSLRPVAPAPVEDLAGAIDGLLRDGLRKRPAPVPASGSELPRDPSATFAPDSDAVPRLLSALQPEVAPTLYQALASTPLGKVTVDGVAALRVKAAPFGAQAPPKTVFDGRGQPIGTEDWPIAGSQRLSLAMTAADANRALENAVHALEGQSHPATAILRGLLARPAIGGGQDPSASPILEVTAQVGTIMSQAILDLGADSPGPPWMGDLYTLGDVTLSVTDNALEMAYKAGRDARIPGFTVTATLDSASRAVTLSFSDSDDTYLWDPSIYTPIQAHVAGRRLTISWSGTPDAPASLGVAIESPLPVTERNVLPLDGRYDGILPGSHVLIEEAGEGPVAARSASRGAVVYPLLSTVEAVETVALSRYGITARATQLTLADPWISSDAVLQSALRPLTIHARPAPLALRPVPVTDHVEGASIELGTLIAGMEPGHLIAVAGERSDLPASAHVPGGEVAMVAQVSSSGAAGEPARTTLYLANSLAYRYRRESVQILGNVVEARQGATITEVLGSAQPAQAHQRFTLSRGPLLADLSASATGLTSSLTVTVNGLGYQEVERFDQAPAPRSFMTGSDPQGRTTIVFAAPLPAGSENVRASYRVGDGAQGLVRARQVTQLLSRPAGVTGVSNPLPGFGGASAEGPDAVRAGAAVGLGGLGRAVTVDDIPDLALAWAAVGKATARLRSDRGDTTIELTIAAPGPVPIDPQGALCTAIAGELAAVLDPTISVTVIPAELLVIVLTATVIHDPLVGWPDTLAALQGALLARFAYANRQIGQDVAVGDLVAAAHSVPAVRSFAVTGIMLVSAGANASELVNVPALIKGPVPEVVPLARAGQAGAASASARPAIAFLPDSVADTVILTEVQP